ncbi:MAG: cell division protein CrgA [Tetrasphaera sp.]
MPESRNRDKSAYTPPPSRKPAQVAGSNAPWFVPVMLALMIVGLLWVVVFYVSRQQYPLPSLGRWNLGVGFALMLAGFMMTTRWR